MTTRLRPWTQHLRRALTAPGNLIAGAGAVLASAVTWNPLPLILYGLGEPVWLYTATVSGRYRREVRDERRDAVRDETRRALAWRAHQLTCVVVETPCGQWIRRGQLPDYAAGYVRLAAMRDQAERIVEHRDDAASALDHDLVARLDDLLRAYLVMAIERLVFHCALAKIYPQLPVAVEVPSSLRGRLERALFGAEEPAPAAPVPCSADAAFVSLADAEREIRDKLAGFASDLAHRPAHDEVYRPMIELLERRLGELATRGENDLAMAAQLEVLPDQMEIILNKLATTQADVGEVIADVKILLEQTDDTLRFAEDIRLAERPLAHN
jgi:hypothetical protein